MSAFVYLNGDFVPKLSARLSVYDHGLLYGDGVWEGMRLRDGDIAHLDAHLQYLASAADAIALKLPFSLAELGDVIRLAIAKNVRRNGYARILITRGPGTIGLDPRKCDPHIVILVDDVVPFPAELYPHGLHVVTARRIHFEPSNPLHRVRSLSHGHMVLAKTEALRGGCLDAILLTAKGDVAGTCEGHLFAVKDGTFLTPTAEVRVPGDVLADRLVGTWKVQPARLTLADLLQADELFLAGTSPGIIAIVRLDDHTIGEGREGAVTRRIREG